MFNKFLLTSFLLLSYFIAEYPSKKENTDFLDYCYSLEKIISRNSLEKSKNLSKNFKPYIKDITSFGTNKTKGAIVSKFIDHYKVSRKSDILSFFPNKFYCFLGYWIEQVIPGTFQSIIYEKSKQKINQYNNAKREVDAFFNKINLEYKSINKKINDFF